jgi:Family of unknown function (DUF6459)
MRQSQERITRCDDGFAVRSMTTAVPPVRLRLLPPPSTPYRRPLAKPLPPVKPFATSLAQAISEVLSGLRPADQLAAVTALDVRRNLERQAGRLGMTCGAPSRCPVVTSVRLTEPTAGVIEACAVIASGARRRALAFRLDAGESGWKCTAVRTG